MKRRAQQGEALPGAIKSRRRALCARAPGAHTRTSQHDWLAVHAEHFAQRVHDLAQGRVGARRVQQMRHHVLCALRRSPQTVQRAFHRCRVPALAQGSQPRRLPRVALRVHLQQGDAQRFVALEGVHAHDGALPGVHFALEAVRGVGDLLLEEAVFYTGQHAAQVVNPPEIGVGFFLQVVGESLQVEAASQRVHGVGDAGLVGDDLLRAQGDGHCLLRRQGRR